MTRSHFETGLFIGAMLLVLYTAAHFANPSAYNNQCIRATCHAINIVDNNGILSCKADISP